MHTIFSYTLILLFSIFITQKKILIVDDEIIQVDSTGTINNLSLKYKKEFDPRKFKIRYATKH